MPSRQRLAEVRHEVLKAAGHRNGKEADSRLGGQSDRVSDPLGMKQSSPSSRREVVLPDPLVDAANPSVAGAIAKESESSKARFYESLDVIDDAPRLLRKSTRAKRSVRCRGLAAVRG